MVLLKHTLPDESFHYDWMFARSERIEDDERTLVTFRVLTRVDLDMPDPVRAERLPDHRTIYLRFEGDIGGGRGAVSRVAQGECSIERDEPGEFAARVRWDAGEWLKLLANPVCAEPGVTDAWLIDLAPDA
jgi:hypothetical protein